MPTTSPLLSGPWRGLPPLPPRPYFLHCSISANTENVVLDEITRCRLMIGCETRTSSKRSLALQLLSPPAYRSKLLYLVVLLILLRICRGTDKTASPVLCDESRRANLGFVLQALLFHVLALYQRSEYLPSNPIFRHTFTRYTPHVIHYLMLYL